ncbi:FAFR085Wp [Eremothecium gossypii FDAG1]|nr:FAFR085Wp [Eremothecium gossypii FDAG1]
MPWCNTRLRTCGASPKIFLRVRCPVLLHNWTIGRVSSVSKMILRFLRSYSKRVDITRVRNIGIIAHIDAGKTTTTERMLYYSGKIKRIGDVDHGDTITDFLPQERSRGITIQSAAISFNWRDNYTVNLIDTPGHADFTFEVIRSLRVLDGCVTILDAVAGVEAQTEKVWKQAAEIPKVCFINKMDRVGAGYSRAVKELIVKLKTRVLLLNTPLFAARDSSADPVFVGVLDAVNGQLLEWDPEDPDKISAKAVDKECAHYEELVSAREALVETLSEVDEKLVEYFLGEADGDYMKVPVEVLNESIRRATLSQYAVPVLCGASFKNIGVQPLLDAVVDYLPSPAEARLPELSNKDLPVQHHLKNGLLVNKNANLCLALAFKVTTDPIRGAMVFIRVYSGVLNSGHTVYNSSTGVKFKLGKLIKMHANVAEDIKSLHPGDIGVLAGANVADHVRTGDTIVAHCTSKDGIRSFKKAELALRIHPIDIPPPVFSAAVEPRTLGNKKAMDESLTQLTREDPSLVIVRDEETGQTVMNGMGELHLEIAADRLLNEFKAPVRVGKVAVSYKETINTATETKHSETDDGYSFELEVRPYNEEDKVLFSNGWYPLGSDNNYLVIDPNPRFNEDNWPFPLKYEAFVNSIISCCIVALQRGGKTAGFPLHSCVIHVKRWRLPLDCAAAASILLTVRPLIISALTSLPTSAFSILEPIMNVEVTVQQQDLGSVVQDLTGARKANILSIDDEHHWADAAVTDKDVHLFHDIAEKQYLPPDSTVFQAKLNKEGQTGKIVKAHVPLKEMVSYMNKLRMLTKGRGSFHMSYLGMERASSDRVDGILEDADL